MKRIGLLFLTLLVLLSGMTALADETSLKVRGTGIVNTTADNARIILGVRESSADVLEAQASVNGKINAIVAALKENGVDSKDIGTENLYIFANYDYSGTEERLTGYTATNTISINTAEMDKVGEYIDVAFAHGANTLENVYFSRRDSSEMQNEALQLAVQNACEKAEIIAEAAGMTIVGIESIDESAEYYGSDIGAKYANARVEATAGMDQSTLVQASAIQISANVLVEFDLSEVEP